MADKWYFARNGKQQGPFSTGQFKDLAAAGELQPLDAVWKEGTAHKVQAGKVKNLFAIIPPDVPEPASEQALPEVRESPLPAPIDDTPAAAPELAEPPPDAYTFDVPENVVLLSLDVQTWLVAAPPASKPVEKPPTPANKPAEKPPVEKDPHGHDAKPRPKRVTGIKGGDVVSQDGALVRFRKKCLKCGHQDAGVATMPIHLGCTRVSFFCIKCKKNQPVEIQGVG